MVFPARSPSLEVIRVYGDPQVAQVGVVRFRQDNRTTVEVVDGLAPPLTRQEKWVINISTQFGCPVGCPFCDAALAYAGNPSANELLAQVKWVLDRHPGMSTQCQKLKVHFARMGEPSFNPAVIEAIDRLPELVRSEGLWCCVATVAPQNKDEWFHDLLAMKERHFRGRFQLQFSVQSTDPKARQRLIPVPHLSLDQLAAYGSRFFQTGDRKVVLNFALARDVPFETHVIVDRFDPERFAVKLTPVNPTAAGKSNGFDTILRSCRDIALQRACVDLVRHDFEVILSVGDEREDQIGSNCGQAVRVERGLVAQTQPQSLAL